jgi:hypothetical protein
LAEDNVGLSPCERLHLILRLVKYDGGNNMTEQLSSILEHLFVLLLLHEYNFLANSEVALNILLVTFVVNVIKLNEFE